MLKSYSALLSETLQNPAKAALHLEAALDDLALDALNDDLDSDRSLFQQLLRLAFQDVIAAHQAAGRDMTLINRLWVSFEAMLSQENAEVIYFLLALVKALGLQVTIAPQETQDLELFPIHPPVKRHTEPNPPSLVGEL